MILCWNHDFSAVFELNWRSFKNVSRQHFSLGDKMECQVKDLVLLHQTLLETANPGASNKAVSEW
jgi:hypothetical protein